MPFEKIRDRQELSGSEARRMALQIIEQGLRSADPRSAVLQALSNIAGNVKSFPRKIVVGFGKASYYMALACEEFFAGQSLSGAIIVPKGSVNEPRLRSVRILEGTHPVPSQLNVESAKELLSLVSGLGKNDLVICLISGGGSALFAYPKQGISLEDKQQVTRLLLAAGANIREINCVRKHISAVKGGQLARMISPARCFSLILSDVVGDDISSVASGPTSPDPSTFRDAWGVLEKHSLLDVVPKNVLDDMRRGLEGRVPETPKPEDPVFLNVTNMVVANNMRALLSMAKKAESLGLTALVLTSFLEGEAREVGKVIGSIAKQAVRLGMPATAPCAIVLGGETTVTVRGNGKGGRNQELALSVGVSMEGLRNVTFASVGSDGIDGNTDAAGAIVDGETSQSAVRKGLSPGRFLENNDSNTILGELGNCLLFTGPTGTNVNDLAVLVVAH